MAPSCGCPDFGGGDDGGDGPGSWYGDELRITRHPRDLAAYDGSPVSFSVSAFGIGPLSYQWQFCATEDGSYGNIEDVEGGAPWMLEMTSMSISLVGFYRCVVSNSRGKRAVSKSAELTRLVHRPPRIIQQPIGGTYVSGTPRTLSVVAVGTPILSYQWYFSGDSGETWLALPGGSSPSSHEMVVDEETEGLYRCVVSDRYGEAISDSAEISVGYAPVIYVNPLGGNYTNGDPVTLIVAASGTPPLAYRWYRDGAPISGGAAAEYSFVVSLDNYGVYRCVVSNEFGAAVSSAAEVFIAPVIVTQPNFGEAAIGTTASTFIEAVGPGTLTYLWHKDGLPLPEAEFSSSAITIPDVEYSDSGEYSCVVTSEYGSAESDVAALRAYAPTLLLVQVDESGDIVERTGNGAVFTNRNGSYFVSSINYPTCLAFGPDGNLYITANSSSDSILKVSPEGVATTIVSGLSGMYGLAFGPDGDFFTSNYYSGTISRVTPSGVVTTFATGFSSPIGLAFDADGNLYVANYGANTVSKVTPAGAVTTFATGFSYPCGLAFDSAGDLYVSNNSSGTISRVTPSGVVTTFATGFSSPYGLAFDSAGDLYVSSGGGLYGVDLTGTKTLCSITPSVGVLGRYVALGPDGNLYAIESYGRSSKVIKVLSGVFVDHSNTHDGYGSVRNTRPDGATPTGCAYVAVTPTGVLSGDFTVEWYLNPFDLTNVWLTFSVTSILRTDESGCLILHYGTWSITSPTPISVGEFVHVAWCRESGVNRLFVGGRLVGSASGSETVYVSSIYFSGLSSGLVTSPCCWENFRISRDALYLSDFPVPGRFKLQ